MTVAPIPIVFLHFVVLSVVRTIASVLFYQVTPVGVVFAVVPVVVVTMVPIVHADLHAGFLRCGACQSYCWRSKNGSKDQ